MLLSYFFELNYESRCVYIASIGASCGLYHILLLYLGGKILKFLENFSGKNFWHSM